jgi:asparagine synthase (glutamine-hydrolysing)
MCGILGFISNSSRGCFVDTKSMAHRGPDASGHWISRDGRCVLGHVRLSIIELSHAGSQPMLSSSGRTVIAFNGEIYNHLELRYRIEGLQWRGHSDTETLVELWERHGPQCIPWLRGMFAFAVYDNQDHILHLVRDRFGIKPLYFQRPSVCEITFASEVRALLGGRKIVLNNDSTAFYLATGHIQNEGEIGEGVEILPPGFFARVDRNGGISKKSWWPASELSSLPQVSNFEEARSGLRSLLEASVQEHLLADVPVASFLSGGIDSSIISLLAASFHSESLQTFCIGFPNIGFDERKVAKLVAQHAGSRHTEIEVSPNDCFKWVREAVEAMDLPSVDAINSYIVSKAAKSAGLKVALSGLGGDELFGGYPSFTDVRRLSFLHNLPPPLARQLVQILPQSAREKLDGGPSFDPFTLAMLRRRWWGTDAIKSAGFDCEIQWPLAPKFFQDSFEAASWAEILNYMGPMLLRDTDQMSMAVSLEVRVPFLDPRLVDFVLALPEKWKRGRPPKQLLIKAFANILPAQVWNRPKQGFALPMDDWMRGPLNDFCLSGLSAARKFIDPCWIDSVATKFEKRQVHWTRLWQLVVLGHYAQKKKSVLQN